MFVKLSILGHQNVKLNFFIINVLFLILISRRFLIGSVKLILLVLILLTCQNFCRKISYFIPVSEILSVFQVTVFIVLFLPLFSDFPGVNWVVQLDCPEDPETYIHRVGRTARLHRVGASLLVLLPSEKAMLSRLEDHKIPLSEIM